MSNIATVISFCTNDLRFLDKCIKSVQPFSKQILIPVCDHFYNGTKENHPLLQRIYQKYPEIDFIEFAYSKEEVYGTPAPLVEKSPGWAQHWHNSARWISFFFLRPEIDWILFVDVDEIFAKDIQTIPLSDYNALRFATYWYFKMADNCATVYPDGPLLVKREALKPEFLLDEDERMGLFFQIEGKKEREFLIDEKPIVHHYSWVKTEEELQSKVQSWGHHWERDWEKLMKENPETDFVRGYDYRKVKPYWDPLNEKVELPPLQKEPLPHVHRVTPKEMFRKELLHFSNLQKLEQ